MALNKVKLGELIKPSDLTNKDLIYKVDDVRGISIKKMFINTKADMDNINLVNYLLVKPDYFSYVTVTSRNGNKISLAHNDVDQTFIVSSSYIVFYIYKPNMILSDYLFIYFNRPEFDRYTRFNSWGSARETFSWEDMCNMYIELPPIEIQQKYVDVYKSMIANKQAYDNGLEDLKLVCDAYIENLRRTIPCEKIGLYLAQRTEKNTNNKYKKVLGISKDGFIKSKANLNGVNLTNYNLFYPNDFVYSPPRINIGSIGLFNGSEICICSPIYKVFYVINEKQLYAKYLEMWFKRKEFERYTGFYSLGSVRNDFSYELMCEVQIPIPSIELQKDIVQIFNSLNERKDIKEKLNNVANQICSVLIKGSIEEAKRS